MCRLLPLLFLLLCCGLSAQSIVWISDCSDKTFCLNQNSCAQGNVFMTQQAVTNCSFSSTVNYSYRIDLNNNGSTDINSSDDTISTSFAAGIHKISWRATDACGNVNSCTYLFTVKDCQPPNLLCINGLTQGLDAPLCEETFIASTFILSTTDNCTPTNQIQVGIRKFGTGTGFPSETTVTYGKCDVGTNFVEVWVRDANGLTNSCQNYVLVQPNSGGCNCDPDGDVKLHACVKTVADKKLPGYTLQSSLVSTGGVPNTITKNRSKVVVDSCSNVAYDKLPFGGSYRMDIRASQSALSNSHLNGVSTFDLLQISRHILAIQSFQTFYQVLAADVNRSNSVTSFDIVEIRKLLLGIYDSLPGIPAWRLIRPVPDPSNLIAFNAVRDTYQINLNGLLQDTSLYNFNFLAVKYGDVNQSAAFGADPEDRGAGLPVTIMLDATNWAAIGTQQRAVFHCASDVQLDGWQMALQLDLAAVELEGIEGISAENYQLSPDGVLRILNWDEGGNPFQTGDVLFVLKLKMRQGADLTKCIALDARTLTPEAYTLQSADYQRHPIELRTSMKQDFASGVQCYLPSPNPFTGATQFSVQLDKPQTTVLAVFDMQGKLVYQAVQELAEGPQSLVLPAYAFTQAGAYVYRLNIGEALFTGKIIRQ